jgi:uncharacterized protein (TIGR02996 family)
MHTEQDFLTGICETPEDDHLRLIFADWLDENGQPERAAFIRQGFRIAEMACPPSFAHRMQTCPKCNAVDSHWRNVPEGWIPEPFRGAGHWMPGSLQFTFNNGTPNYTMVIRLRKGFLHSIELPSDAFLQHAATLFRNHPIEDVRLTDCRPRSPDWQPGDAPAVWQRRSTTEHAWPNSWQGRGYGVPDELFDLMPKRDWAETDGLDFNVVGGGINTYPPDVETAYRWLSESCVEWGREQAGLSPLPVRVIC